MAAAIAARGSTQSIVDGLVGLIARVADDIVGPRIVDLLASTAATRPTPSPFGDYGVLVASGSKPLPITSGLRDVAVFTIEEARERLKTFVSGRFVPDSLSELIAYLGERFLRLETRLTPQGAPTNYIVDQRTNQSIPAAQVDQRLSHKALLQASLRASLRRHVGAGDPASAWNSWEGMAMVLDNDAEGLGYTLSDGVGWFGKVHAVASNDPERNLLILRSARAKGLSLVVPYDTRASASRGTLIPGMPILVRTSSLPATEVHKGFAHDRLSTEWGVGIDQAYMRMAERFSLAPSGIGLKLGANVLSIETFQANREEIRRRFVRRETPRPVGDRNEVPEFGGIAGAATRRDLAVRIDAAGTEPYVYDRVGEEEVMVAVRALPPGRYPLVKGTGRQIGWTEVGGFGAVRYMDLDGNGPRPRPTPPRPGMDSIQTPGFAISMRP